MQPLRLKPPRSLVNPNQLDAFRFSEVAGVLFLGGVVPVFVDAEVCGGVSVSVRVLCSRGRRSDKSCFVPKARRGKTLIMQKVLR